MPRENKKIKLSEKQKEVMALLRNRKDHKLHWMGGLNCSCFLSHDINYKISVSTALKLREFGLVKSDDERNLNQVWLLTKLGKEIKL